MDFLKDIEGIVEGPTVPMADVPMPMQGDLIKPVSVSVAIDSEYHISPNFTYGQLVTTNNRNFINLNYDEGKKYINNLTRLCNEILEPIVVLIGEVPIIDSAFRCVELNTSLGASKTSQHMDAEAGDTKYRNMSLKNVFNKIADSSLPFGQLIFEFSSWVHVSVIDNVKHPGKVHQKFTTAIQKNAFGHNETVYIPVNHI